MKTEELDRKFDDGEDVLDHFDLNTARRPNRAKRVNIDFPQWMITALDGQATKYGVSRQAVVKIWLAERLKAEA
jgi:hypothetical protein